MYLEKGQHYYIEGDYFDGGGAYHLNIGLKKESTSYTADDVPMAVQEQQYLKIWSSLNDERQVGYIWIEQKVE